MALNLNDIIKKYIPINELIAKGYYMNIWKY